VLFAKSEIQYVLTVPAVWSDKAKATTLKCAERAGYAEPTLITEPEAAAVYSIRTMDTTTFEEGDTFIICDAGGGTVVRELILLSLPYIDYCIGFDQL
jgi:molecular chaperone DnaK (HSP70)